MIPIGQDLYNYFHEAHGWLPDWDRLSPDFQARWNGLANDTLNSYVPADTSSKDPSDG